MASVLLVATVFSAGIDWWARWRRLEGVEVVTKPLTTVLVIALALVAGADTVQTVIAVVALALCLVGDVVLMPLFDNFVLGLGAFLLGHMVFVALFLRYGLDVWWMGAFAAGLTLLLVVTVGRQIVEGAGRRDAGLRLPVAGYLAVISAMTIVGWSTGRWLVVAGTALFVTSDSILGWSRFVASQAWMSVTIMITYHGAIGLLALSLW